MDFQDRDKGYKIHVSTMNHKGQVEILKNKVCIL